MPILTMIKLGIQNFLTETLLNNNKLPQEIPSCKLFFVPTTCLFNKETWYTDVL